MWETQVQSLGREDSLEKEMATYSCLGNPTERGAWQATVHETPSVRHEITTKQQDCPGPRATIPNVLRVTVKPGSMKVAYRS